MTLLIVGGEVDGRAGVDVVVEAGIVTAVGRSAASGRSGDVLDARGGAVIPGLHDHHVHLRATAAQAASVVVGPPEVQDAAGFSRRLITAAQLTAPGSWIRCVGYDDSVAGPLDALVLDSLVLDRALRVQHRSGKLWILNTLALEATGANAECEEGVERDIGGLPTGRLWRMDSWLRRTAVPVAAPLEAIGPVAAAAGITGFTDADPERDPADLAALARLPQRVHVMGPVGMRVDGYERLSLGPVKILLDDDRLPTLDALTNHIRKAHSDERPIAAHCVTRMQLVLLLAAIDRAGPLAGDRIEHAAIVPPEAFEQLRRLGIVAVTQPGFVTERGDQYLAEVDPRDQYDLWRCKSLLDVGIPVAASTDAPFGCPNPWSAITAATQRRTASGAALGLGERVEPDIALSLFLGDAAAPSRIRRVAPGVRADLCVLRTPISHALNAPDSGAVAATIVGGVVIYSG